MNAEMIRRIAEKYDAETTGDLGFLFTDLATGETVAINLNKEMPAASTFKVFLLAEFLRQCETGKYNLMDRHILTEDYISSGSGILCDLIPGMNLTLLDYARLMMMLSDNSATDYIYGLTGRDNIQKNVIEAFELTKTKCDYPCKKLINLSHGIFKRNDLLFPNIPPQNSRKRAKGSRMTGGSFTCTAV